MEAHDSLPYIDADISQAQRDAATSLLRRELPRNYTTTLHPSLTDLPPSHLTPLLQQELARVAAQKPLTGGIDLTRYEAGEDISSTSDAESLKAALRTTYTNTTYLRDRQTNISLLEEYGKNAWLISNSHLEDIQKRLDGELAATKARVESTNVARKTAQEDVRGELLGLNETWGAGVDRIVQTQLAVDGLRRDLREVERDSAGGKR